MFGSIFSALGKIPPAAVLGGAGLAYDALRGNQMPAGYNQVKSLAAQEGQTGQQLTQAGLGGPLPVGAQEALASQEQANMARTRQAYDSMGLGDSTMVYQAQQANAQQTAAMEFQIRQSLLSEGLKFSGLAAPEYAQMMDQTVQQDKSFGDALSAFAAALAGSH